MTVLRGIGAIVLCFVVVSALSFGVDGILHATGVFPPWGQPMAGHLFTLALAYRIVFDTFGTWIVARLAPSRAGAGSGSAARSDSPSASLASSPPCSRARSSAPCGTPSP